MTMVQVSCACGAVQCAATGAPIVVAVCYCDDCQRGGREIEALPGAAPVLGEDLGTAYVLYRKDRFECTKGKELLRNLHLVQNSPTKRVVAGCCNSAMYLDFQKGHWVNVYRVRYRDGAPPVHMLLQTRFKTRPGRVPGDVPAYRTFPPRFFAKLLWARIAMLWSHGSANS